MLENLGPKLLEAAILAPRYRQDRWEPRRTVWREYLQRILIFRRRAFGAPDVVAVGFVDGDHVGKLDDALLDPLQIVPTAGEQKHQEEIDHIGDCDLGLTNSYGLDNDDVETRGLDQRHGLACPPCHATKRSR